MNTRAAGLVVLLVLVLASPALADSWRRYPDRRVVDPTGTYYVVIHGQMLRGASFIYAKRAKGAAPVAPASDRDEGSPAGFGVREGDEVIAKGNLKDSPIDLLVSSRGHGFVAVEKYGQVGYGNSVAIVGPDGEVRHEKTLGDLFDAETIEGFTHTVSSIWWRQGQWLDEEAKEVVLIASGGRIRVVSLESGEVREGGPREVLRGLDQPAAAARSTALDLMRAGGLEGRGDRVIELLVRPTEPMAIRLRAAALLGIRGDRRGRELLIKAARKPREKGVGKKDRTFALSQLPKVLGAEAMPILRDAMSTLR